MRNCLLNYVLKRELTYLLHHLLKYLLNGLLNHLPNHILNFRLTHLLTSTKLPTKLLTKSITTSFEGVYFNSRHPGPRRAWKGGSEQQWMTPLRRHPAASVASATSSKSHILYMCFISQNGPVRSGGALGEPWEVWVSSGRLWRSSGRPWESGACIPKTQTAHAPTREQLSKSAHLPG